MQHPDPSLIALGIQQPWGELILQGIKTIEVRSVPTRIRGPIYLYASQRLSSLEAASVMCAEYSLVADTLPRGRLIGTVEILDCRPSSPTDAPLAGVDSEQLQQTFSWVLGNPCRCPEPIAVRYVPYGLWFYPFRRKSTVSRRRRRNGGV